MNKPVVRVEADDEDEVELTLGEMQVLLTRLTAPHRSENILFAQPFAVGLRYRFFFETV